MQVFLEHEATLEWTNAKKLTPLHAAVFCGSRPAVKVRSPPHDLRAMSEATILTRLAFWMSLYFSQLFLFPNSNRSFLLTRLSSA